MFHTSLVKQRTQGVISICIMATKRIQHFLCAMISIPKKICGILMDQKNQKVICVRPILLISDVNAKQTTNAKVDVAPNLKTCAIISTAKKKNGTNNSGSTC